MNIIFVPPEGQIPPEAYNDPFVAFVSDSGWDAERTERYIGSVRFCEMPNPAGGVFLGMFHPSDILNPQIAPMDSEYAVDKWVRGYRMGRAHALAEDYDVVVISENASAREAPADPSLPIMGVSDES